MKRVFISGLLAAAILGISAQCLAQEAAAPAGAGAETPEKPVEVSAGLKLLAGGNLWTTPSNNPPGNNLGFDGDGGGFGWGAALYGEGRFFKHLGVELDLGYDSSTLTRNTTYNGVVKVDEKVTASGPRISLLVKGIVPTQFGRLWFGIGPEFVIPSSVSAENEITEGANFVGPAETQQIKDAPHAKKESSTMLALVLGMVFHAGDKIEIPVDIRAAKNLSQESDYDKRVKRTSATNYEVSVQNSWDFRLAVGAGYRF